MKRKSKRELQRQVDRLEAEALAHEPDPGLIVLVPDSIAGAPDPPDVESDVPDALLVPVGNGDSGHEEVAVPNYRPPELLGGFNMFTYSEVAALWEALPLDILEQERALRREQDEPLPPILLQQCEQAKQRPTDHGGR